MKIIIDYPPNFKAIEKKFGPLSESVIFTYGDTIYSPQQGSLSDHLIVHEEVHSKQQGNDPKGWWKRYLKDDNFRLEQEVEAYKAQYQSFKRAHGDKNLHIRFLHKIAADLSGKMYGSLVTHREAMNLIMRGHKRGSKNQKTLHT